MKCLNCGAEMLPPQPGTAVYPASITVVMQGVPIHRCPSCDEQEVEFPQPARMHRALVQAVANKPSPLSPGEIRFLRKSLGWSGKDFAVRFETTSVTVSRWETGASKMNRQAELLLRFLSLTLPPIQEYTSDGPIRDDTEAMAGALRAALGVLPGEEPRRADENGLLPTLQGTEWHVPPALIRQMKERQAGCP